MFIFHNHIQFQKSLNDFLSLCNYHVLASFYTVNDITRAFYFTVNSLIQMVKIKSMNQYYKFHHPLYKPAHICIENQLLITTVTVMLIAIRHNRNLTTLKAVSYFK